MADIRKCFSTVGDTTLTKWLDKGLIGCESDKKGIRTNISYSALELAHVGVLAQLSTWGVLNYYKDVKVDFGGQRQFLLTEPDRIIDHYCYYILEVAEIIQALAGTTLVLVITIDGDEIVLG